MDRTIVVAREAGVDQKHGVAAQQVAVPVDESAQVAEVNLVVAVDEPFEVDRNLSGELAQRCRRLDPGHQVAFWICRARADDITASWSAAPNGAENPMRPSGPAAQTS